MTEFPMPLVPADCDCRDLDGFMLNVERLMASELVALSTHEEIAAALLLWCRAWKQLPAASLPDDDRVNAAFARLPLARFRKVKDAALRHFVKCSDGRLYHAVLSEEAKRAFAKKKQFKEKRETDSERLRKWRRDSKGNASHSSDETHIETTSETRFVQEGQGRDSTGTGTKESKQVARSVILDFRSRIVQAFEKANSPNLPDTSRVEIWAAQGYDLTICAAVVAEGIARKPSVASLKYFDSAIKEAHEKRANGHHVGDVAELVETSDQRDARHHRMFEAFQRGTWPAGWGLPPGHANCEIPKEKIEEWSRQQ